MYAAIWAGPPGKACKPELGEGLKTRKPAEVDHHSVLGSLPEPATQDAAEHTSPPQLQHLNLEEQVQTSPHRSAPTTPRGGRPNRATHKPDLFNPSPPKREEKRRMHLEHRMLERQAAARETAEARGYPVPPSLGLPAIAGDLEQAPADCRKAPCSLPPGAVGDAQPMVAQSSKARAIEMTFARRGRGRQPGRARGASRGGGRVMAGRHAPVRGRHGSVTLERAARPPSQNVPMPDTAEAPAQPLTSDGAGVDALGGSKGRKRIKEGKPVAPSGSCSKQSLQSGDIAQGAAKKPRRSGAAAPSVAPTDSTAAKRRTAPGISSNRLAGKMPTSSGHECSSNAGFAKKFQGLLGLVQKTVVETFDQAWGAKPAMMHSMSRRAGEEVTAGIGDKGGSMRRSAAPKSLKEESDYRPEESAPSSEDSPESDSDSEVVVAPGSKKKPASAKGRAASAGKRGQKKGDTSGAKNLALAPARQPMPPSEG